jgi:hypothetical protein
MSAAGANAVPAHIADAANAASAHSAHSEAATLVNVPLSSGADRPIAKVDPIQLQKVLDEYLGMFYNANVCDLGGAAIPCMRCMRDNRLIRLLRNTFFYVFCCGARPSQWLFCSELVSWVYVDLGIFPLSLNPANVMPTDFLPRGWVNSDACGAGGENSPLMGLTITATVDADKEVPWVFTGVVRYHV